MLTKGIILNKVVDSNKYLVRIPFLENSGINNRESLSAILSTNPSITEEYKEGDVVIVGFEDHDGDRPIIIGKLFTGTSDARGHANFSSLDVSGSVNLPKDTLIDGVSIYDKIFKLDNLPIDQQSSGDGIISIYNSTTPLTNLDIQNNTDYTYQLSVTSNFSFTIPNGISQGFLSLATLNNVQEGVNLSFINNSSYTLRLVHNNNVYSSSTYVSSITGRKILMFRCDGYYIEVTIVEEKS